jgi:hypothetical protein
MFDGTFRRTQYLPALGLALVTCGLLLGCDGKRVRVQGYVTLGERRIDGGRIFFLPDGEPAGRPSVHAILSQGKYALPAAQGPELGRYRVEIVWHRKPGKPGEAPAPAGLITDDMKQLIPAVYNSQSTLFVDVQRGTNSFDFALKERP